MLRALSEEVQGLRLSVQTQQEAAKERVEALEAALDEADDRNHMKYEELRLRGRDRDSRLQLLSDQVQADRVRQRATASASNFWVAGSAGGVTSSSGSLAFSAPDAAVHPHAAAARCP